MIHHLYFSKRLLLTLSAVMLLVSCGPAALDDAKIQELTGRLAALQSDNSQHIRQIAADENLLRAMADSVYRGEDGKKDMFARISLDLAQDRVAILAHMLKIRTDLQAFASYDPETGLMGQPNENTETHAFMMGHAGGNGNRGDGRAGQIGRELRDFRAQVANTYRYLEMDVEPEELAPDPAPGETWEAASFGEANALQSLVKIEETRRDLLLLNDTYLAAVFQAIGLARGKAVIPEKAGKMVLRCIPRTEYVAVGLRAEADVFIENLPLEANVEFSGSGTMVTEGNAKATLTVTAPGGFPKGKTEKEMTQRVRAMVRNPDKGSEELTADCLFKVRIPMAEITPSPDKPLLRGRQNTLTIRVPDLGKFYNPKFSATNAEVKISASDKNKVFITPMGSSTELSIMSMTNGQVIMVDKVTFQVVDR